MNEPTDGIIHRLQHSEPPGWPDLEMMEAAQGASCMVCGHIAPFGVWNAENPKIGVCVTCRERAQEDPLREQVARLEKALNDAVERAHRASQEVERLTQANITDQLAQALDTIGHLAGTNGTTMAHIQDVASTALKAYRASKEGEKWQDETAQRLADNYKAAVESGNLPEVP